MCGGNVYKIGILYSTVFPYLQEKYIIIHVSSLVPRRGS